jgi:hypothetical protein
MSPEEEIAYLRLCLKDAYERIQFERRNADSFLSSLQESRRLYEELWQSRADYMNKLRRKENERSVRS